jgi:hypothetical protein
MPAQQIFTLEEVNSLVPELATLVGNQLEQRDAIETMLDRLAEVSGEARGDLTPRADDSEDVRSRKRELLAAIDAYHHGWKLVERMGGVLKDPRYGLVDFYGHVDNQLVWLCWKYGENEVRHYHRLDEGFSSRKQIRDSRRRLLIN